MYKSFIYDLEIEISANTEVTRTIDRGQTVTLVCRTIFGDIPVRSPSYTWSVDDVDQSNNDEFDVSPTSDTVYECNARGRLGKITPIRLSSTIRIIIRGKVLW